MRIREPTTSLVIFSSVSKTICLSSSSRIAFLFFGLFIFLNTTTISTSYNGNETDYLALMSFKSMITQDPYGALRSWNNSFHFCDWNGVSCGKLHRRVIMLNMSSQGLVGSLSPHVGNLSFLRVFGLFDNTFQGNIPHELIHLFRLRELNLGKNNFSGVIPTNISSCSNLGKLGLHYNKLVGIIPMEFSLLSRLIILSVGHNNLTGHIPVFLGNFTSMEWFFSEVNPLGGSIPDTLGHCRSLKRLYLGRCNLYGTIPHSIYNLSLLPFFSLPGNHLMGSLPPTLGAMLPLLEYLQLRDNQLTGLLPPLISNCSNLQVLDLGNNNFSGKLIIDFASPTGTRDCQQLEGLILNGNQFEGELPSSLSKCRSLKVLDLGNNHLNGTLPVWLGGLQELQVLLLKSNKLHGPIECPATITLPFPSLKVLDLSHNGFTGYLPEKYFQNCRAMKNVVKKGTKPKYLNIGGLYYFIIVTVKDQNLLFTKFLVDYTIIDLSNNRFEGEIPNIIGSLNSLIVLNLSHNSLTGQIPHALGNLSEIESLDLSWNQLIGTIPQSLANITNLAVLNLSQNHLMGHIPEGTQFTTFEENSFGGNPGLCGHPLPKMCEHPHEPQLETNGDTDSGFTWKAVVLGYGCGTLFGMVMGYLMLSTGRPKWFNAIAEAGEYMIQKWQNKRRYVYIGK